MTEKTENHTNLDQQQQPQAKSGCLKFFAVGCITVLLIGAIGTFIMYRELKGFISGSIDKYTENKPAQLPVLEISKEEETEVLGRLNNFAQALEKGKSSDVLSLTSKDINILISRHPDCKGLAGKVYVTIEGNTITGKASIPLNDLGEMVKGRYLNGSMTFRVGMEAGRLLIFIDEVYAGGKPLPEEVMTMIRSQNLAEDFTRQPDSNTVLQKLDSIKVQDGRLLIIPKSL